MTTTLPATPPAITAPATARAAAAISTMSTGATNASIQRITSASLMDGGREVEIEHAGRIYRLRITQLNKLILTA